jgi:hypothetical protein
MPEGRGASQVTFKFPLANHLAIVFIMQLLSFAEIKEHPTFPSWVGATSVALISGG